MHKPEGLTTFGRSIYLLIKSFDYKYLSLASDGQFSPAGSGQGHWLFQTIVVRHKVRDINAWLNGHQDRVKIFAPAISGFKTFQDTDDPKSVVLVVEVTDMEKLTAIMKNTKIMEDIAKARHTVLEPIIMSMPVDL